MVKTRSIQGYPQATVREQYLPCPAQSASFPSQQSPPPPAHIQSRGRTKATKARPALSDRFVQAGPNSTPTRIPKKMLNAIGKRKRRVKHKDPTPTRSPSDVSKISPERDLYPSKPNLNGRPPGLLNPGGCPSKYYRPSVMEMESGDKEEQGKEDFDHVHVAPQGLPSPNAPASSQHSDVVTQTASVRTIDRTSHRGRKRGRDDSQGPADASKRMKYHSSSSMKRTTKQNYTDPTGAEAMEATNSLQARYDSGLPPSRSGTESVVVDGVSESEDALREGERGA